MFEYGIYGCALHSELELPLPRVSAETTETVTLTAERGEAFEERIQVRFGDGYAELRTSFVRYTVFPTENRIHAEFRDGPEDVVCTLLNIPFSLFFLGKKELLLHCGCLEWNGDLTAVAAAKGVGKTTLVTGTAKKVHLFSDDTLRISEGLTGYGVNGLVKLTKAGYEAVCGAAPETALFQRADGKLFVSAGDIGMKVSPVCRGKLKNICFLERNRKDSAEIVPVAIGRGKYIYLLSNVVGISYFDGAAMKALVSMKIFHDIINEANFYRMSAIDDIGRTEENSAVLAGLITAGS